MARAQSAQTHCKRGHPFTPENTMRRGTHRVCRACKADRYRVAHPRPSLAEILWERIAPNRSGCWFWTGSRGMSGYGIYDDQLAHRLVYELIVGPIPEGLTLDHGCHNRDASCTGGDRCPHRACVNPSHLEPSTIAENVMRGQGFAAVNARKTHCPAGHLYDEANTYISPTSGWRACRACNRERARARTGR